MSTAKKVLGLFKKEPAAGWCPADRPYPQLTANIVGVPAQPGIYALWHRGVRPQWLRVAAVKNLASALAALATADEIVALRIDVFVAWAQPPANQHAGIVRFLGETLRPARQDASDPAVVSVAFPLPPGTTV